MKKWGVLLIVAAVFFLLGAKTTETVSYWKSGAYQVVSTFGKGIVQVYFIDKDPNTNADILRCGQKLNTLRTRELATDLNAAADDADGTAQ